MAIEDVQIPLALRAEMGVKRSSNLGGGFSMPMSEADKKFLQDNKNTELFRTFVRMARQYMEYTDSQLRVCDLDMVQIYRGQRMGAQAILSMAEFAAHHDDAPQVHKPKLKFDP